MTEGEQPPRMTTVLAQTGCSYRFACYDGRRWLSVPGLNKIETPEYWHHITTDNAHENRTGIRQQNGCDQLDAESDPGNRRQRTDLRSATDPQAQTQPELSLD